MRARLDTRLVACGLAPSREKAKRLILAGVVRVNGQRASKASDLVGDDAALEVEAPEKYVSRGGHKLEAALESFNLPCADLVCADIGASTGGFTDCLLQRGAARVHAVDVGKGQLGWRLRLDPRVIVHDDLNARHLTPPDIGGHVDLVTIDVSFISLIKVLPAAAGILKPGGTVIALIKPQFEAGRKFVKKGGVVRDSQVHETVKRDIQNFATTSLGLTLVGIVESPLLGPAGNKEFFVVLRKP
ncbi:MAG TPA: TlyA family RNA methyltransferase [Verrucomicrobiae bacterium]|nr:TlyA family RNA methyltransferase [Verrucomicrobiae bacterium]